MLVILNEKDMMMNVEEQILVGLGLLLLMVVAFEWGPAWQVEAVLQYASFLL